MIFNFLSSMLQHGTINLADQGGVHLTLAVKEKKKKSKTVEFYSEYRRNG